MLFCFGRFPPLFGGETEANIIKKVKNAADALKTSAAWSVFRRRCGLLVKPGDSEVEYLAEAVEHHQRVRLVELSAAEVHLRHDVYLVVPVVLRGDHRHRAAAPCQRGVAREGSTSRRSSPYGVVAFQVETGQGDAPARRGREDGRRVEIDAARRDRSPCRHGAAGGDVEDRVGSARRRSSRLRR